jgi:biotin-(acetyl-CoA carboxylase) ligase
MARVLAAFEPAYEEYQRIGVAAALALWESHADIGGPCQVHVAGRAVDGVMAGVDADGALLVDEQGGHRHRIIAGEVSFGAPGAVR